MKRRELKYPLLIILAAFLYGIAPAFTKMTYDYGGNGITLSVLTPLFAIPCFAFMAKRQKQSFRISRTDAKKVLVVATFGTSAGTILLYFSYEFIPVGMATALQFISPVVVAFVLVAFFHEKLTVWKVVALVVSVAGIAAVSLEELSTNPLGITLALLSGVCYAFNVIYLDKSGLESMNTYLFCFYSAIVNTVAALVVGLAMGQLNLLTTASAWFFAFLSAFIGRILALPCFQFGLPGTGPLAAGILCTFEPIVSVLVGILLLGESTTASKLIGCLLVVLGVCLIVYADVAQAKKEERHSEVGETSS